MKYFDEEYLDDDLSNWPKLTKPYNDLFNELAKDKYEVRTSYEHFVKFKGLPDFKKITIVLRIDVDNGYHLSFPLALHLFNRGLKASHFFLCNKDVYYDLRNSKILNNLLLLNQEVGLHSDHFTRELVNRVDGLEAIRNDVKFLNNLCGSKIKGMVYHGDAYMQRIKRCNIELYDEVAPSQLNLEYHDGIASIYRDKNKGLGVPICNHRLIDYMGILPSRGWNYLPSYPLEFLKKYSNVGEVFCIDFHTLNAFEFWENWPSIYNEKEIKRDNKIKFKIKKIIVIFKYRFYSKILFTLKLLRITQFFLRLKNFFDIKKFYSFYKLKR